GLAIGVGIAVVVNQFVMKPAMNMSDMTGSTGMAKENKPLYWVAPMDANYRRDKPGQSPMGMDLIPFYANEDAGDDGPGTVRISPDVVNNLGVRTAIAKRQSMHSEIKTVGYVKYDEDKLLHIHPRVEGWIETLYVKAAGDPVKEGQPLYDIYSPALVNAQEEFVLALGRKNKRLIRAVEDRLTALQLPKSVIEKIKKTKQVNQTITIVAPQSGVVDNLNIREGVFVKPGNTVMSIGSLEQVWVEAEVFERQVFQVSAGLPVTMTLDFLPGKSWIGKVDYVYPTLNAKTRTVKIRLRFDNKSRELKPNMFAEVVIHAKSDNDVLLVPREAIIRTGSVDRVVLALGEGRFKSIEVNVGRFDEDFAEIAYGLKEGESVVTSAQFLLDSESSKTSDFKRMNHDDKSTTPERVWVDATINNLMPAHRMVNLDHKAIDEWGWADMTMDFTVVESVDYAVLKKGLNLQIEIQKAEDFQYLITNIRLSDDQTSVRDE
ncbi:MAG: efflux RND transporter periplasmic adaptor subunit, partial [Pseudomonadales bacterium]|nr:efflux RND transporter periplasmic adaptor subunit [Pseudomonadales bacterium]